jgi:hypothetical protein
MLPPAPGATAAVALKLIQLCLDVKLASKALRGKGESRV